MRKGITRRKFLKVGGVGVVMLAVGGTAFRAGEVALGIGNESGEQGMTELAGKELAMVIDLQRCIACKRCISACRDENNLREGHHWACAIERKVGEPPNVRHEFIPTLCNHCIDAPCVRGCPVGAMYKGPGGLTMWDSKKCIGCRYCMINCPYSMIFFNETEPRKGTVEKCHFCYHRIREGKPPACVEACPAKARIPGDLNDPYSNVNQLLGRFRPERLKEGLGYKPKVFYIGGPIHEDRY
ncbi:MAG: 4Fe-4S dicluster domain-containing protein [Dehalococcoidia bacterium]|nr:4Fe-4S dicluster domain-containing protein [Dehalococcoidia bacterium]